MDSRRKSWYKIKLVVKVVKCEIFGVENLIADRIDTLKVEKSQARLYDEQTLTYGELTTVDSEGNKKAFFYVLSSLELEMYERHREENSDVQISKGKIAEAFEMTVFQNSLCRTLQLKSM